MGGGDFVRLEEKTLESIRRSLGGVFIFSYVGKERLENAFTVLLGCIYEYIRIYTSIVVNCYIHLMQRPTGVVSTFSRFISSDRY